MIVMWSILFSLAAAAQEPQEGAVDVREKAIVSFDEGTIPDNLVLHSVEVRLVPQARGRALHVDFSRTDWPNIFFEAGEKLFASVGFTP